MENLTIVPANPTLTTYPLPSTPPYQSTIVPATPTLTTYPVPPTQQYPSTSAYYPFLQQLHRTYPVPATPPSP